MRRMERLKIFVDDKIEDQHISKLPLIEPPSYLNMQDSLWSPPKLDPEKYRGVWLTIKDLGDEIEFQTEEKKEGKRYVQKRYSIRKPKRMKFFSNAIHSPDKGKSPVPLESEQQEDWGEPIDLLNPNQKETPQEIPSVQELLAEQDKLLKGKQSKPGAAPASQPAAPVNNAKQNPKDQKKK